MRTSHLGFWLAVSMAVLLGVSLAAQESQPRPHVAPSGRVTTRVIFDGRVLRGGWWFTGTPGIVKLTLNRQAQPPMRR